MAGEEFIVPLVIGLVPMYFGVQQLTRIFYERKMTEKGYFRVMFNRLNRFGEFFYVKPKDGKFTVKGGGYPFINDSDYIVRLERMPTVVVNESTGMLVRLFNNSRGAGDLDPKKFDGLTRHSYNIGLRTGMKKLQNIDKLLTVSILLGLLALAGIGYLAFGKEAVAQAAAK